MKISQKLPMYAFLLGWAIQFMLAFLMPEFADEAYYTQWSRNLSLGYLDHPPAVAWWIKAGFGYPRLPGLVLLPLGWLALADAGKRWGVPHTEWVPALAIAHPLGMGAGFLVTPDVPLIFFWCLCLNALARNHVALAGLLFGFCLLSKSTAVLCLPGLFWVLGLRRAFLFILISAGPSMPHFYWSVLNDGFPWRFQASRAFDGIYVGHYLGGQLLVGTPVLVVTYLMRAIEGGRRRMSPLLALSAPIFVFWLCMSFFVRTEANWTALGYPPALLFLLQYAQGLARWCWSSMVVMTLAASVLLPVLDRALGLEKGPPRNGARLGRCLASEVQRPWWATRYQETALLREAGYEVFYWSGASKRISQYDLWLDSKAPPCGASVVGPMIQNAWCEGQVDTLKRCGRIVTRCICPESEESAKGGSRTPTP